MHFCASLAKTLFGESGDLTFFRDGGEDLYEAIFRNVGEGMEEGMGEYNNVSTCDFCTCTVVYC